MGAACPPRRNPRVLSLPCPTSTAPRCIQTWCCPRLPPWPRAPGAIPPPLRSLRSRSPAPVPVLSGGGPCWCHGCSARPPAHGTRDAPESLSSWSIAAGLPGTWRCPGAPPLLRCRGARAVLKLTKLHLLVVSSNLSDAVSITEPVALGWCWCVFPKRNTQGGHAFLQSTACSGRVPRDGMMHLYPGSVWFS